MISVIHHLTVLNCVAAVPDKTLCVVEEEELSTVPTFVKYFFTIKKEIFEQASNTEQVIPV